MDTPIQNTEVPENAAVIERENCTISAEESSKSDDTSLDSSEGQESLDGAAKRKSKRLFTCFYCEFSVEKSKYLKSHIKTFHMIDAAMSMPTETCLSDNPNELEPDVPPPEVSISEETSSSPISVPIPESTSCQAPSQTKKFDMDLCPYCDFSDKNEKRLRHHILSKHSKELDKIIIYNYTSDDEEKNNHKKVEESKEDTGGSVTMSFNVNNNNNIVNKPSINEQGNTEQKCNGKNSELVPSTVASNVNFVPKSNHKRPRTLDNFKCTSCDFCSTEAWELMVHLSESHPEELHGHHSAFSAEGGGLQEELERYAVAKAGLFTCIHCSYITDRSHLLNRHILSKHSDRKPHKCHVCEYATKRLEHLNRHILSKHSGERPFPCQFCDYRASRDDHLRNHMLSKHSGEQLYRCVHCGFPAMSSEHLNVHMMSKHSEQKQEYMCQKCGFVAANGPELKGHMESSHSQAEIYQCDHCPYTTGRLEHLNRHFLAKHSTERPYRCKLCEYSSARSEHLNYHLMSKHRDERPHVCTECDYRATRLSHLQRHILSRHSGIKPFLCPHCDYQAARLEHLHRHVMARHADTVQSSYSCYGCEFVASSKELLDHHVLSAHIEGTVYSQFSDIKEEMECEIDGGPGPKEDQGS